LWVALVFVEEVVEIHEPHVVGAHLADLLVP